MDIVSLPWERKIETFLAQLNRSNQFRAPLFPTQEFQQALSTLLCINVDFSYQQAGWLSHEQLCDTGNYWVAQIYIDSIEVPIYLLIEYQTLQQLLLASLQQEATMLSEAIVKGIYQYFLVELCVILDKLPFIESSYHIGQLYPLKESSTIGDSYVIEWSIKTDKVYSGKLLLTQAFERAWNSWYPYRWNLLSNAADQWEVKLRLDAGNVALTIPEIKSLNVGDFLILDRCTYDPSEEESRIYVTLHQHVIAIAIIKEGCITLKEKKFYQQVLDMDEENYAEYIEEDVAQDDRLTALEDVKVDVHVELGSIKMAATDLLHLSTGTVLTADHPIGSKVFLRIEGKKVAEGELVKVGELLGVRITRV